MEIREIAMLMFFLIAFYGALLLYFIVKIIKAAWG